MKQFYQRLGWRLDDDIARRRRSHRQQFTPPGSACSVTFGKGITAAAPGSAEGALIVSDIEAAHDALIGRGIEASNVWHGPPFPREGRQPGPDPKRTSYGSFVSFNDPDGNTWLVQEVTTRAPGRVLYGTRICGGPGERALRLFQLVIKTVMKKTAPIDLTSTYENTDLNVRCVCRRKPCLQVHWSNNGGKRDDC